jgi:CGNR zinc finger
VTATARYGLEPAPAELRLTQELLNTTATNRCPDWDLLSSMDTARAWFGGLAGAPELSYDGLFDLLELRDCLRRLVRGEPATLVGTVEIRVDAESVVAVPVGAAWLRSAIAAECLVARAKGIWSRLKVCRSDGCPVAFYDYSRNGGRVWCDVSTCGNVANVRAHRARNDSNRAADQPFG